jgi:hypothetical protein
MSDGLVRVGTAGWLIPRPQAALFPGGASHLERYARGLPATQLVARSITTRASPATTRAMWS